MSPEPCGRTMEGEGNKKRKLQTADLCGQDKYQVSTTLISFNRSGDIFRFWRMLVKATFMESQTNKMVKSGFTISQKPE